MKTKQIIALAALALFTLSVVSISFAGGPKVAPLLGVVTAIDGSKVTIVDAAGVSVTKVIKQTQIIDAATVAKKKVPGIVGISVGDNVEIKKDTINLHGN